LLSDYIAEVRQTRFYYTVIRIASEQLAGVPSVVYWVFGLGFFVYILGGNIDQLFSLNPRLRRVFGTPGLYGLNYAGLS